jgi:hypothetical protein
MGTGKLVARNWRRILILLLCFTFSVTITWYNFRGGGKHSGILTFVLLLLLYGLIATGIIQLPPGSNIPFFTVWPRLSDAVKSVISFLLIFLWTPMAMRLAPDTPIGVAIILVPDAVFLLATLVYLSNGLSRNLK